jgi:hypothetical protein
VQFGVTADFESVRAAGIARFFILEMHPQVVRDENGRCE